MLNALLIALLTEESYTASCLLTASSLVYKAIAHWLDRIETVLGKLSVNVTVESTRIRRDLRAALAPAVSLRY